MAINKGSIGGNSYVGAFSTSTDEFTVVGTNLTPSEEAIMNETLGTNILRMTISGSNLVGIYAVANARALLLPDIFYSGELDALKKRFTGIEIEVFRTDLNALKNNILVNDKVAIVNPEYSRPETKRIADALGVEVLQLAIGGFKTVGANNILTNKGIVLNNNASDGDVERIKDYVSNIAQTTANLGSPAIGLCVVANSRGAFIGEQTTGFELARVAEGLDL